MAIGESDAIQVNGSSKIVIMYLYQLKFATLEII